MGNLNRRVEGGAKEGEDGALQMDHAAQKNERKDARQRTRRGRTARRRRRRQERRPTLRRSTWRRPSPKGSEMPTHQNNGPSPAMPPAPALPPLVEPIPPTSRTGGSAPLPRHSFTHPDGCHHAPRPAGLLVTFNLQRHGRCRHHRYDVSASVRVQGGLRGWSL